MAQASRRLSFGNLRRNSVVQTVLLAVGAAAADWFAPLIFSGHSLVLGVVFYWTAVRRLGSRPATVVLLVSFGVLTLKWGQPYSGLLLAVEAMWVGWNWNRGRNPLLADLVFWGVVGTPISWFLYKYVYPIPHPSFEQALVVQVVNGAIAVWIAAVVIGLVPKSSSDARPQRESPDSFRTFLLKHYLAFGTFPVLIFGLIAARQFERNALAEARANLVTTAEKIALSLGQELERGYDAVENVAARLSKFDELNDESAITAALRAVHGPKTNFITMLAADSRGKVVTASVRNANGDTESTRGSSFVNDREYFTTPLATSTTFISNVFQGRGLGRDILFAISSPVTSDSGVAIGIVEGSCKVSTLESLLRVEAPSDAWRVLLTDRRQRVIAANGFSFQPLASTAGTSLGDLISQKSARSPAKFTADDDGDRVNFLSVTVPVPRAGWSITVQRKWADILSPIIMGYLALLFVATIAALVAIAFTAWSIRDFLKGWSALLAFARDPIEKSAELETRPQSELPREFNELIRNLSDMARRLNAERTQREHLLAELESRVQTRTEELQSALIAAQAADRAKSAFLATVSHELRTPLTSIINGTGLLKMSPSAKTDLDTRTLRTLEKSSHVLMSVISDVLDYSKLEAGGMAITHQPFRPASVVTDILTILTPTAKQAGLSLTMEVEHDAELEWTGDATHVQQVLVNLAGNALKFTKAGFVKITSSVREATPSAPRRLCFLVQDSGPGIAENDLAKIFEPFVQLESNPVASQAGTGLGLPISRKLAQIMGGRLTASSRLGEGATFEFWIPESNRPEPSARA